MRPIKRYSYVNARLEKTNLISDIFRLKGDFKIQ